jgi:hypothetical protein
MIQTFILSKNRPAQLHLLLESIYKNSGNQFKINVIYDSSTNEIDSGYTLLQERFFNKNHNSLRSPISWTVSKNIKESLLETIDLRHEFCCFFVDDNIVFNTLPTYKDISSLFSDDQLFSISTKIGNNTVIQDPYSFYRSEYFVDIPSSGDFLLDKYLVWDATQVNPYTLFSLPLSFDGHLYRAGEIKKIIEEVDFIDASGFQENSQTMLYNSSFSFAPPTKMACLEYSATIKNTIDKVADHPPTNFDCFEDGINSRYITGYKIDYSYYDFSSISMPYERFLTRFVK